MDVATEVVLLVEQVDDTFLQFVLDAAERVVDVTYAIAVADGRCIAAAEVDVLRPGSLEVIGSYIVIPSLLE